MHHPYIVNIATPWQESPCSEGYEIHNFGKPFLGHHYYSFNFLIFAQEEKRFFYTKSTFFINWQIWPHHCTKKLCLRSIKFTISVNSSWVFFIFLINLSDLGSGIEKEFLRKKNGFSIYVYDQESYALAPETLRRSHEIYKSCRTLLYHHNYTCIYAQESRIRLSKNYVNFTVTFFI